ncbi:MAG: 50S ribosomal protein L6 [Candidatus Hydrogenedentota bacterium]|jgi:large subunit ribosomal protein L6|nr:MAG: 50S ribosomal protein L6 [Candidatus Hydrogenedentota bacterium]GIX45335.1 MAG: 50S ribosomal protein L6 [Candidatus Sumerlaea sp.]
MSRIGKIPVPLPKGTEVKIDGNEVSVKGPKGQLSMKLPGRVSVEVRDGAVHVTRHGDDKQARAFHGLTQRLIRNMVIGVTEGFKKELEINGVGYRASLEGKKLVLQLGYSHPVEYEPPTGITLEVPKQTSVIVHGIDKQLVGEVAAKIRSFRPPEPYKGKGIKYVDERILRKVGKAGAK